jgi:hypothetical protein
VAVSYETVRRWVNHFGPMIAADLRKRRLKPHTTWHLDEVYLKIDGRMVYLWRAVDAEGYGGDLLLGLIDDQQAGFAGGLGFQSMEFTITANGVEILDSTFRSLAVAESFFHDRVIDLGSSLGPDIDLTFGYNLVADGSGGFGFDFAVGGAVPEPSTWAMMLIGFAGLGYAGYRRARESHEARRPSQPNVWPV